MTDDWKAEVTAEMEEVVSSLNERRNALAIALSGIDAELRQANRVLKELRPPEEPKPKAKKSEAGTPASPRIMRAVATALLKLKDDDEVAALNFHESQGFNWADNQTHRAFKYLRDQGILGKHGTTPRQGRTPGRQLYIIQERDLLEHVAKEGR